MAASPYAVAQACTVSVTAGSAIVFLPPKQTGPCPKKPFTKAVLSTHPLQSMLSVVVAAAAVMVQPKGWCFVTVLVHSDADVGAGAELDCAKARVAKKAMTVLEIYIVFEFLVGARCS